MDALYDALDKGNLDYDAALKDAIIDTYLQVDRAAILNDEELAKVKDT